MGPFNASLPNATKYKIKEYWTHTSGVETKTVTNEDS